LKSYLENKLIVVCSFFLFAFFLRLSLLPHLIYDPAFIQPIADSKELNWLAHELANINAWQSTRPWFHVSGYAYFLALVYKILGFSVVRLAIVQYLLGSVCVCLVYLMAKRLIGSAAALFAGVLMSVYWMLLYTQSHVLSTNLSMPLNLLAIYCLLPPRESWYKYLIGGFLLGLSAAARPDALFFICIFWVWLVVKKLPLVAVLKYYGLFLLGAGLCVVPLFAQSQRINDNFKWEQTLGINLYIGSMPDYWGSDIYISLANRSELSEKFLQEQGQQYFDRQPTEREINSFFFSKTFDYIKEHPLQWAGFMAGKLVSVLIGIDYPRPEDVYFYDKHIRFGPFSFLQTWFICVLALTGMVLSRRQDPQKLLLPLLFLFSALPALFFNYKSRDLVPYIPFIILFSSYTFHSLIDSLQRKSSGDLAYIASTALALLTCVFWNPANISLPSKADAYHAIGSNLLNSQNPDEAQQYFLKALEIEPEHVIAINDLGVAYMTSGKFVLASETFQRALGFWTHPLFAANYEIAQKILMEGGTYDPWEGFPEQEKENTETYYRLFPYPYKGAMFP
jgi:4-amino-4-deoxy-L-arabinose transferase-like glycosyltransferase